MAVNRYKIRVNQTQDGNLDRNITLPIQITTDEFGRGDLIEEYENETIEKLVELRKDYEVTRYSPQPLYDTQGTTLNPSPSMFYNFNFGYPLDLSVPNFNIVYRLLPNTTNLFNDPSLAPTSPCPQQIDVAHPPPPDGPPMYIPSDSLDPTTQFGYELQNFSPFQTYSNQKSFVKSFYKLDLYDSPLRNEQQLYISIILNPINSSTLFQPTILLPTTQETGTVITDCAQREGGRWNCKPQGEKDSHIPSFELDATDNNEGYYIYWLKEKTFLDIDKFYMSAKFYNGKTGRVTSFITVDQNTLPNPYSFDLQNYLYYQVTLNQLRQQYSVSNSIGTRIGVDPLSPIRYWQYFNPQ